MQVRLWLLHGITLDDAQMAYDYEKDTVQDYAKGIITHDGLGVKESGGKTKSESTVKSWWNSIKNKVKNRVSEAREKSVFKNAKPLKLGK